MESRFKSISLNEFLSNNNMERVATEYIETFRSPQNKDIESFLKHHAIEFTKKGQSVTYLVIRKTDIAELVGYYTLTIKPITISNNCILSNTLRRRIERVCKSYDGYYSLASYLIAQFGKNYGIEESKRIDGKDLLKIALNTLTDVKYRIGGVAVFVECEEEKNNNDSPKYDVEVLKNFYTQNDFNLFGERISDKKVKLYQLVKAI